MDTEERKEDFECQQVPNSRNERNFDKVFAEVKKLLALAGPLMLVNLLLYSLQVISVMFVGHQGKLALSGASMAVSFAVATGFSLLMGMGSALETLCVQSHGAQQYHMLGIHMQRAMFVNLLVSIPLAFVWTNAGHILVILRQDPEIAAEAGAYARFMIPSIFAFALLECQIRFLQAQNNILPISGGARIFCKGVQKYEEENIRKGQEGDSNEPPRLHLAPPLLPVMLTTGVTALMHVFGCWILMLKTVLGSRGAALSNATSCWINVFLLAAYIKISPCFKSTWTGFSTEALSYIPRYLRLAIPSALMIWCSLAASII